MDNYPEIPLKALSIMQPWAWLIVNGHKDIENRDWATKFRGPVAIHAGKKMDGDALADITAEVNPASGKDWPSRPEFSLVGGDKGGIVGIAEIHDCVSESKSEWFVGKYGFVIKNASPVGFIPVRGALGFFDWRKNL